MRLDEWQKFIESQFLEETAVLPPPVKPAPVPETAQQTILALDDEPSLLLEAQEAAALLPSVTVSAAPTIEKEAEPAVSAARPASVQTTPRQTGFVVRSVVEDPIEAPAPLPAISPVPFDPAIGQDADIPDFADYLPPKSVATASPIPETLTDFSLLTEEPTVGPVSVLLPLTSGFISATPAPMRSSDGGAGEIRRKRAPQARNIPTENTASGLSSADLWSQVPRHVQTLLALERREEEREVAQSSYKRPFQEKRAELIARILDPVLSLEDTARLLNVCPTTVRRYTNKGILTHYRKEPERPATNPSERETRQRRFRLSDILTFLETQQSALEADRLQERVAPSRRKRTTTSLDSANQE